MKLDKALELGKKGLWQEAQVRKNPSNLNEWFVILRDTDHKPFMLVDNDDQPLTTEDMNALIEIIHSIDLKEFTVFL